MAPKFNDKGELIATPMTVHELLHLPSPDPDLKGKNVIVTGANSGDAAHVSRSKRSSLT